ncbi:MAG: SIR2 family protein [Pseudonocardiales bacterium]|nr:SIR2 family protein [Pseudonocardiales bacterium]
MIDDLSDAYGRIAELLRSGKIIPLLGAGANLCGRPLGARHEKGRYLPSGKELAEVLAAPVGYPQDDVLDLARVSQYVAAQLGEGSLYDQLHDVFDADYPPTSLHYFLARWAGHARAAAAARNAAEVRMGTGAGCMLIATVNYDNLLEQAFQKEDEPYDLITYINDVDTDRGLFWHTPFDGHPVVIREPNNSDLSLDQRTIIAKIHGAVEADSFVITEDDYVDYITRADIARLFPVHLVTKIMKSHFLFFGYSLRDWNFRVMLYRMWQKQRRKRRKFWVVEANPREVDRVTWDERGVNILPVSIEDFLDGMEGYFP